MNEPIFSEPKQKRIYQKLNNLVGPGAAGFFQDICRLMELEPPLEATTHFVGHALREIESSLRDILEPLARPKVNNPNNLQCPHCKNKFPQPNQAPSHRDEINAILAFLQIEDEEIAQTWLKLTNKRKELGLHKRAHRDDLSAPRPMNSNFRDFWTELLGVLDGILDRLETKYLYIRKELDQLLNKEAPEKKDLDSLRLNIPNSNAGLGYFFRELQHSEWLNHLWKEGFFKNLPTPSGAELTEVSNHPFWPQADYLVRMAQKKVEQDTLYKVVVEIFETQQISARVLESLIKIILELPLNQAAQLTQEAIYNFERQEYVYLISSDSLVKLIVNLAQNDKFEIAITLTREILGIAKIPEDKNTYRKFRTKIKTGDQLEGYYFNEILDKCIPCLLEVDALQTLNMLCSLLDRVISISESENSIWPDSTLDWQLNIDKEFHWSDYYEIEKILSDTLLSVAIKIAEYHPLYLEETLLALSKYDWCIFTRINFYLIYKYPNILDTYSVEYILKQDFLYSPDECYEYKILLQNQFNTLNISEKKLFLDWIDDGPPDFQVTVVGHENQIHKREWQRDKLCLIKEYLDDVWRNRYENLVSKLGSPSSLMPPVRHEAHILFESPLSREELSSMELSQLFSFLETWQPSGEVFTHSVEELAWELSKVIEGNPDRFLSRRDLFNDLRVEYRLSLIRGLSQTLQATENRIHEHFSWEELIQLCIVVLKEKNIELNNNGNTDGFVSSWNNTCKCICDFLIYGLRANQNLVIPFDLRCQVWEIVQLISRDPLLSPNFHESNNTLGSSYSGFLNKSRSRGLELVIEYAYWVVSNLQNCPDLQGFNKVHEAQDILDYHLVPGNDSALSVRAIYGRKFFHLLKIDLEWSQRNLELIFPHSHEHKALREAAWEGYIRTHPFKKDVFYILREEYKAAILRTQSSGYDTQQLQEHLLKAFLHKDITIEDPDDLLVDFLQQTSTLRHNYFLGLLSWYLEKKYEDLRVDVFDEVRKLWDWYIDMAISSSEPSIYISGLKYFCSCLICKGFDRDWSFDRLLQVMNITHDVTPIDDKEFLMCLSEIFLSQERGVIECLSLLAKGERGGFWFHSYQNQIKDILAQGIDSNSTETHQSSTDLINRLSAGGHESFLDLLSPNDSLT